MTLFLPVLVPRFLPASCCQWNTVTLKLPVYVFSGSLLEVITLARSIENTGVIGLSSFLLAFLRIS